MKPIYEVRTARGEVYQYLLDGDHVIRSDGIDIGYAHEFGSSPENLVEGDIIASFSLAGQSVECLNLDPHFVEMGYPAERYDPIDRASIVANIGEDALNRLLDDAASYGWAWFDALTDPAEAAVAEVLND